MPIIIIWIFLALILTLSLQYYDSINTSFIIVNLSMGAGLFITLLYEKIYRQEWRKVYWYLDKYLKDK